MITVKNKGRVRHLPDSCLKASLEQKKPGEKIKYKELSANTVAFHWTVSTPVMSTDVSQVGVALSPSF